MYCVLSLSFSFSLTQSHTQMHCACHISIVDVALLDLQGPIFVHEPPYRIEFSNNTGGHIHCSGHANPYPEVSFQMSELRL